MSIYMKIDGIKGNTTENYHQNWIRIEAINFNVARSIKTHTGSTKNREISLPCFNEINIVKQADMSSPLLFSKACQSSTIGNVTIDICHTGNSTNPYSQYILENVIISQYHDNSTSEKACSQELLTLNFTKVTKKYIKQNSKNVAEDPITAGYDLTKAQVF